MSGSNKTPDSNSVSRRKPYASPRLVSYGHVKDIVQGNAGDKPDSGTTMMCRVAEALYGADDPRTLLIRGWLTAIHAERRRGWRLVALYRRWGGAMSALIRMGCLPRRTILRLFDRLADKAFDRWARVISDGWHQRTV